MQAYYYKHLTTQRPRQSQASGELLDGEGEEVGLEFPGPGSGDPSHTPWEPIHAAGERQVFSTQGLGQFKLQERLQEGRIPFLGLFESH